MFHRCAALKKFNITNFNTLNVTNMNSMYKNCPLLEELILPNLNTNHATDLNSMFFGCSEEFIANIDRFNNLIHQVFINQN